jgi:hypothetical protein
MLGRLFYPAPARAVKIKVQWSSNVGFQTPLNAPLRTLRRLNSYRNARRYSRRKRTISALTGHWRGLMKWPTQILSSRQPARPKNRAGAA